METKHVSKRAKALWMIANVIVLLILTTASSVTLILCWGNDYFSMLAGVTGASWAVVAALLLIWPSLRYKNYTYSLDDKRLIIRSGVIFKHQITAPVCQIQDLHLFEGPVMRLMGLGRITLSTGGSNFDLDGLEKSQAQALIEELEGKLRARIEVQGHEKI